MIEMKQITFNESYASDYGYTMNREDVTLSNGHIYNMWVFKNEHGILIDLGFFRNEIAENNGLYLTV